MSNLTKDMIALALGLILLIVLVWTVVDTFDEPLRAFLPQLGQASGDFDWGGTILSGLTSGLTGGLIGGG